jgi:copper amine oxidase-like protein
MSKPRNIKFKKSLKKLALAGGALFAATSLAVAQPSIGTELNGSRLTFDQPPVMQDGRVLVPLRGIFESLGADVLYSPANRTIKATANGQTVELTLGQRQAFVDGRQMYLDVPADTINGRTMVPLRFVSEAMGADVKWLSATRTVAITHDGNQTVSSNDEQPPQQYTRPEIGQLIHNARGTLNPGDELTVTIVGEPNARASFSILGATQEINMTEVSPGRYEGRLRISNGLQVNDGTLVGYLRKNNLETLKEASRSVTVAAENTNTNIGLASVTPDPGTIVGQNRPTLRAVFPEYIRQGSASIQLDGQNFNPSIAADGRSVAVTPSYSLNPGIHQARATAYTQNGQLMERSWNFTVSQSATNTNQNTNQPSVSVNNLTNGSTVPAVFNIQGQTSPYTKVKIDTTAQRPLIPGIIGLQGRRTTTSTVSDAQGNFNVQLNTQNLPSDSRIDLDVSVMDSSGNISDTVDINLIRQ